MQKKRSSRNPQAASLQKNFWAPWRIRYIKNSRVPGCFLCKMLQAPPARDRANLLLLRGKTCFVCFNRFPYNGGHLMIAPRRHVADLALLRPAEHLELMHLATTMTQALKRVMNPDGFNLGINLGAAGGAGLLNHLHLHIVPRWTGDTNFMPIFADIKVIPQALEELYDQLATALQ